VDGPPAQADGLVRPHLVGTTIYKMTGSGNDFVMVDGRHTTPAEWSVDDIRAVCARGTGVGADGLVFVGPGSGPEGSGGPDIVRMVYFNSDGSRAAMCGNAALCSTRLAARLGLASPQRMILETDAATYESRCMSDGERAELHLEPVRSPAPVPGLAIAPGVVARGRLLRSDPALGPAGANVNFISPAGRASEWRMRTYERGVEDETLACGTGAVAAACALADWSLAKLPVTFWTRSARRLEIRARKTADGAYDDVWLGGEARLVVRGVIN